MYCDFSFTGGLRDIVKCDVCRPVCDSVHWKGGGGGGGLCPGVSFQGGLCLGGGGLCPGGLCPGGLCLGGGSLSRGSLPSGVSVQGVSVQGGLCPVGSLSRGSLSSCVSVRFIGEGFLHMFCIKI